MMNRFIAIFCAVMLMGFTTVDIEKFEIEFDQSKVNAQKVYKLVEEFSQSEGFNFESKVEERYPNKTTKSVLRKGVMYGGGVLLELNLSENEIIMDASRYRGGCTRSYKIEMMEKYIQTLESYLSNALSEDIHIKKMATE